MKGKLEEYFKEKLESAKTYKNSLDILNLRAIAFGALDFCLENGMIEYEEIKDLWDYYWEEFHKLAVSK